MPRLFPCSSLVPNRKTMIYLYLGVTAISEAFLYYSSTLRDDREYSSLKKTGIGTLAIVTAAMIVAQINNTLFRKEDHDSDGCHHHEEHHECSQLTHNNGHLPYYEATNGTIDNHSPSPSRCSSILSAFARGAVILGAGAATFNLFIQNLKGMEKMTGWESQSLDGKKILLCYLGAVGNTLLQSSYHIIILAIHCLRNIEGTDESFMMRITGITRTLMTQLKTIKERIPVFLFLVFIHAPDGFFLSQEVKELAQNYNFPGHLYIFYILCGLGTAFFSVGESVSHLDHCSVIKTAWSQWKKNWNQAGWRLRVFMLVRGGLFAFTHSVTNIMDLARFIADPSLMIKVLWGSITTFGMIPEAGIGILEGEVHLGGEMDRKLSDPNSCINRAISWCRSRLFRKEKANEDLLLEEISGETLASCAV